MSAVMTDFLPGETFYLPCLESPANPVPAVLFVEYVRDSGRCAGGHRTVRVVNTATGVERTVQVRHLYKIKSEAIQKASQFKP